MHLPPAFDDRPVWLQLLGGVVVPAVFGLLTGFALGWHEVLYLIMAGPLGIGGGFFAGMEHRGADDGFVRGAMGGLVFGSFILLGSEITNNEPKAHLPDPQAGLVFVTTFFGAVLGAFGGAYRARRERRLQSQAASAGSIS
jgi:hypothetical protein